MFKVLDLFSGIGGFSLGLERTGGFKTVAFCEIEEFPRKVLAKHWPDVPIYHDIRELTGEKLRQDGIIADVITGGFPCQDISVAGKRAGIEGERSGLWSELCRVIGDVRPQYAIVENVANLLSGPAEQRGGWFGRVLGDLAEIGYNAEWRVIYAKDVDVPQSRPRVWIVAYSSCESRQEIFHKNAVHVASYRTWLDDVGWINADAYNKDCGKSAVSVLGDIFWPEIPHRERGGNNERLSSGMGRYKAIGNAVVPQIPELIGRAILEAEGH